jgi:hypothetical protein
MQHDMILLLPDAKLPDFEPTQDEIITLTDKLLKSQVNEYSGILRYPYADFLKLSRIEATKIFHPNNIESFDAFIDEFNLINLEITNTSTILKNIYTNKLSEVIKQELSDPSAKDVFYLIEKHCIKAKRLIFVSQPDYSLSTGYSKKSKKKYETVKAFWIDSNGNKVRSFSKNVGIEGVDIEESVVKLFESLGYITTQLAYPLDNGYNADLIVEKNGSKWVVEVKIKDKKRIFDTFARLELWKLYQSIYWD